MTRWAALSRPAPAWVDGGECRRCRHTLWRVVDGGALVAKSTMSSICRQQGRKHEVKA